MRTCVLECTILQGVHYYKYMSTPRLRLVGIGLTYITSMEIRTGVKPGDRVVVVGHNWFSEGDPV